jgi:hypothetical protein
MYQIATKNTAYKFLGRIPELNYILLRDTATNRLELWTESRGIGIRSTRIQGVELEFVREARSASRVVDNDYNRRYCPDDIGRIYIDTAPTRASVKEL